MKLLAAGGVAQVVERLPCMSETLSSNPAPTKIKKENMKLLLTAVSDHTESTFHACILSRTKTVEGLR
jgi:hypothetical protein